MMRPVAFATFVILAATITVSSNAIASPGKTVGVWCEADEVINGEHKNGTQHMTSPDKNFEFQMPVGNALVLGVRFRTGAKQEVYVRVFEKDDRLAIHRQKTFDFTDACEGWINGYSEIDLIDEKDIKMNGHKFEFVCRATCQKPDDN